jgi:hypothetical protein
MEEIALAVQDSPKYDEWSEKLERLKEADERYRDAKSRNDPAIEGYVLDLHKAQEAFNRISGEIE